MEGTRGKVGDVVFRVRNGKTYVSALPEINKNRKLSDCEVAARKNFIKYNGYAKRATTDPVLGPLYAAAAKKYHSAFNIAMKDAAHPPEVQHIVCDRNINGVHDKILIFATDDFKVKEVKISIVSAKGKFIEEGYAELKSNGRYWVYETLKHNEIIFGAIITATAADYPGNTGSLQLTLS